MFPKYSKIYCLYTKRIKKTSYNILVFLSSSLHRVFKNNTFTVQKLYGFRTTTICLQKKLMLFCNYCMISAKNLKAFCRMLQKTLYFKLFHILWASAKTLQFFLQNSVVVALAFSLEFIFRPPFAVQVRHMESSDLYRTSGLPY